MNTYFFDKTLTIRREKVVGTDRTAFSATSTSWGLSLQPQGTDRNQLLDGYFGKLYAIYVDIACPATEGDIVVVGGKNYLVKGVSDYDFGGLEHKKLTAVQKTGDV